MRAAIIAASLALAACGAGEPRAYPEQYRLNFMQACEAMRGGDGVCPCLWARIEAEVPVRDFERLEALPAAERAAAPLTAQITAYAQACAVELGVSGAP